MRRTIDRLCKEGISLRSRIQGVGVIDLIDGGDGIDVVQYSGSYADYRITKVSEANGVNGVSTFRVVDTKTNVPAAYRKCIIATKTEAACARIHSASDRFVYKKRGCRVFKVRLSQTIADRASLPAKKITGGELRNGLKGREFVALQNHMRRQAV